MSGFANEVAFLAGWRRSSIGMQSLPAGGLPKLVRCCIVYLFLGRARMSEYWWGRGLGTGIGVRRNDTGRTTKGDDDGHGRAATRTSRSMK